MPADETFQARQAALLLHGLAPEVRRQVMGRLDRDHSSRLAPLLRELDELGVPASVGRQIHQALTPPSDREAAIDQLSADDVAKAFESISPVTIGRLLAAREWRWKSQLLERLPDARRHRAVGALAPAAMNALYECLLQWKR